MTNGKTRLADDETLAYIKELEQKLSDADDFLSQRCTIDPCGFDVEKEPVEILRDCMKAIDQEAQQLLAKLRGEG